ncbi:MAG: PDZ domain-containing protein [Gemmataceae bacterium]|nr:PDZ domain-containing protein [Gemmataceae bacterium]
MKHHPILRVFLAFTLLAGVAVFSAGQDSAQPDAARVKQIAELERQIQDLQAKLKALKEPGALQLTGGIKSLSDESLPANWSKLLAWRCIGPANMGGRITGLAVFEADPSCYYVATASGGLLKTVNNGSTFEHQFDKEATVSIGAVAVAQTNRDLVWIGTGEANPRNSVSYGDGVYKSIDGGKTWKNMGLKRSFQIGKIIIHPKDPNIVYVGALGRLYGPNQERGLYKTTDGGKSWQRVLHVDNVTGVLDLVMHPQNPEVLIAATWERERDEFDSFRGNAKQPPAADVYAPAKVHAPGTQIYKSLDGGKTWKVLTQGLPKAKMGRIGLDWHRQNPNLVFAVIDTEKAGTGLPPSQAFVGLSTETAKGGLRVIEPVAGGPAAKAGVKKGEIVLSLDAKELRTPGQLVAALQPRKPGDTVKLRVSDDKGQEREIDVTLGTRPAPALPPGAPRVSLGADVEEAEDEGIVVTEITAKGAAEKAGLQVGDVILEVEGTKLTGNPRLQIIKLMVGKNPGDKLKITYRRGGERKDVEVTLEPRTTGTPDRPYGGRLAGQAANVQDQQGPDGVNTGGIYKSTDGGESWTRVNSLNERPFYFSVVRVDPTDEKIVYHLGVNFWRSTDGGKTFKTDGINKGIHADHHDLWINPRDGRHMIIGTDGGFYVTYDRAANWEHFNHFALGQYYHVAVDNRRPYRVYGGLQDNGSWGIPSHTLRPSGPTNPDALFINGGDGFVCRVDPFDPDLIYAESQDGNLMRRHLTQGGAKSIRPKLQPGATKYRFNWNTPFILSAHNPHLYYCAGNYVFRSFKQGENSRIISPEITRTKRGSATALAESPKNPEVLWVGADDGAVWLTRDGGKTWANLTDKFSAAGLPGPRWVSTIEASHANAGRCYVVFDAHRSDDDEPYVFATEDYGQTWRSLRGNLPSGTSRVLREDIVNPNVLYLGTEFAAWASINRGQSWFKINGESLPTVAVHEFAQPTTAPELVAGTHGRSIWVLDVSTLRQAKPEYAKDKTHLFAPARVTRWRLDTTREGMFRTGTRVFQGQNPSRNAYVDFVLGNKTEQLELKVVDIQGKTVRTLDVKKAVEPGFHRIAWDLSSEPQKGGKGKGLFTGKGKGGGGAAGKGAVAKGAKGGKGGKGPFGGGGPPVKNGVYRLILVADGQEHSQTLVIEPDPNQRGAEIIVDEPAEELEMRRLLKLPIPAVGP